MSTSTTTTTGWSSVFLRQNLNFLFFGVAQNLFAYQLDKDGIGSVSENGILASVQPLGAVLLCLVIGDGVVSQLRDLGFRQWWSRHWMFAICDLGGGIFSQLSMALIGSGMFTVIYSSIVVYIAALNRLKFHRDVSTLRWIALGLIVLFVAVSALGQLSGATASGGGGGGGSFLSTLLGIASALGASVSYGTEYVLLSDYFERDAAAGVAAEAAAGGATRAAAEAAAGAVAGAAAAGAGVRPTRRKPVSRMFLLFSVSLMETFACLLYFVCVVIPRWEPWVAAPMRARNTTALYGVSAVASIALIDGTHQIGFYYCCGFGKVAATSSGVNKALQAAILFVISAWIFCDPSDAAGGGATQCLNAEKSVGTAGVCISVLLYACDGSITRWCGWERGGGDGGNGAENESDALVPTSPKSGAAVAVVASTGKTRQLGNGEEDVRLLLIS